MIVSGVSTATAAKGTRFSYEEDEILVTLKEKDNLLRVRL